MTTIALVLADSKGPTSRTLQGQDRGLDWPDSAIHTLNGRKSSPYTSGWIPSPISLPLPERQQFFRQHSRSRNGYLFHEAEIFRCST
jgi:hypothetical protein